MRTALLVPTLLLTITAQSQFLHGRLQGAVPGTYIHLLETRGNDLVLVDSANFDDEGRFAFANSTYPTGFYELTVQGTDRVDIILNEGEKEVELLFHGVPLQHEIQVLVSEENRRLWTYKRASREAQLALEDLQNQRIKASPYDHMVLQRLDSAQNAVQASRQSVLDALISEDPDSYFTSVVLADRRLMVSLNGGTKAVRDAVDWDNASLVRSAVYPKGIMALLQSATPATPDMLKNATDSVLHWAQRDLFCWDYARTFMTDLFLQYGPEEVVQHLVDKYVLGPQVLTPPDMELLAKVAEQIKLAVGGIAPNVLLPKPGSKDTLSLAELLPRYRYTTLFFYSSTCDHCHEQMPGLSSVHQDLRSSGVHVIGVALDADPEEFERTIVERKISFPCYSELLGWGSPAAKAFAVKSTPHLILLDREGRIVAKPYDHEELRRTLLALLK